MEIRKALSNEKGLTLIEVLASIAILVIVLGIGMAALAQSSTLTNEIKGESQERQDMQVGLLELTKAVQEAKDIKKGTDEYNFEITNTDNSISKYWLVDGQLNSDVKSGQTPVEGVRKMTIVDKKGITLDIDDLEEPVVLARRGGGVIETGLGAPVEEEEPPMREADIVCRNGEFTYQKYQQFKDLVEQKNQWGNPVNAITCNSKDEGVLTISKELHVALSAGDIRIDTGKINMEWRTQISLSNGSIYLPYTKSIDYADSASIHLNNNLVLPGAINLHSNGKLEVGGNLSNFTGLTSGTKNTIIVKGSLIGNTSTKSEISLGSNTSLTVNKDVKNFKKITTHSNPVNINILGNVTGDNIILNHNTEFTVAGDIQLNEDLKVTSTGNKVTAKGNVLVDGDATLFQALTLKIEKDFYVGGNLKVDFSESNNINIGDRIIVVGNADIYQKFNFIGKNGIWIKGNLDVHRDSNIMSDSIILIKGNVTFNQMVNMTSKESIYLGKKLDIQRESTVTTYKNLYVQEGIQLEPKSKIVVNNDSLINGQISFPIVKSDGESYLFNTQNKISFTGPIQGSLKSPSGTSLFNASNKDVISSINTLIYFPDFPNKPN